MRKFFIIVLLVNNFKCFSVSVNQIDDPARGGRLAEIERSHLFRPVPIQIILLNK